jgi:hypothetical protein
VNEEGVVMAEGRAVLVVVVWRLGVLTAEGAYCGGSSQ